MNKRNHLLNFATVVAGLMSLVGCGSERKTTEKVSIGIQSSPAMGLVMVAKEKGFFAKEDLDAELKEFTAGKFALQAFLGGSLDFAVAGEVPVTLATLQGSRFLILSQVVQRTVNEVRIVARRDGQLNDAASYFKKRKRKLATSLGGGPEFFTYVFLKKYGISGNDVEIISQQPQDMPAALANGSVDAISIFDPFAYIGEKQLGDKAIVFTAPDIYSELYVLTVRQETIDKNPGLADKMIRALVAAQQYIQANPDDSQSVVAKDTMLQPDVVRGVWQSFVFAPALTPLLLDYQTQEAAWAKETGNVTTGTAIPDFRKSIYDGPLRKVKPESVSIQ